MDAEQAGDGHVHGAQSGRRHAENEPDARHLVTLAAPEGTGTLDTTAVGASCTVVNDKHIWTSCRNVKNIKEETFQKGGIRGGAL